MNKKLIEALGEYKKLLDAHDWFWRMSDSRVIRDKGYDEEKKLKQLASTNGLLQQMYDKRLKKMVK